MSSQLLIILVCIVYALFNVTGTSIIKYSLNNYQLASFVDYIFFVLKPKVIFGIFLNFASMLVIIKALSIARFSYVFPVAIGIHFVSTMIVGNIFFGDRLTIVSVVGMAFIFVGITMMSMANA